MVDLPKPPSVRLPNLGGVRLPNLGAPDVDLPRLLSTADKAINATILGRKQSNGTLRPLTVVPYMGWYAGGVARLSGRVIERPSMPEVSDSLPMSETLKQTLRRFTVLTAPGITVRASMAGRSTEVVSDADGYIHVELEVGEISHGWHVMDLEFVLDGKRTRVSGRVLAPDLSAGVIYISDIDDTILKTGLTQGLTAARRTFLRDVTGRRPVKGMPTLYQGLQRGLHHTAQASFFYVSTGSWNMYDYLSSFLDYAEYPIGPMFLTDWGPTSTRLMRDGKAHKVDSIRTLLAAYPDTKFVLIGDVGQKDPETYEQMMREHGDQVLAAMLIYVGSHLKERTDQVAAHSLELQEEGIEFHYISSAADGVALMWQMGLVDRETPAILAQRDQ